jgi:hypothetical protein
VREKQASERDGNARKRYKNKANISKIGKIRFFGLNTWVNKDAITAFSAYCPFDESF